MGAGSTSESSCLPCLPRSLPFAVVTNSPPDIPSLSPKSLQTPSPRLLLESPWRLTINPLDCTSTSTSSCPSVSSEADDRFSDVQEFEKPNDRRALDLMNRAAKAVMDEFEEVVLGFGESDEFS